MIIAGVGAVFTLAADGDLRGDPVARRRVSDELGIEGAWATVNQVHGATVVEVTEAGNHGEADALYTTRPDLPLAVFTADCVGVVVHGSGGVGVAHAGWRGTLAGVVEALIGRMKEAGVEPEVAFVGPAIGPCCYEVGPEVRARFVGFEATTRDGRPAIDLPAAVVARLEDLLVNRVGWCTVDGPDTFSHRRSGELRRMAALGWRPG